jgi:hypothetical protein
MTAIDTSRIDEAALKQFAHQSAGDLAAAISGLMVVVHRRRVLLIPRLSVRIPIAWHSWRSRREFWCGRASGGVERRTMEQPDTSLVPWRMAMTLRLTDEDEQALALLAEAQGISKQEATVRAIRDAAARRLHEDRVRDLSAAARARYADVLERLGR